MIISIFGYQVMVFKKGKKIPTISTAVKIASDGRFLFLCDKHGEQLTGQLSCTIHERINQPPYATVEIMVSLDELLTTGKTIYP